MYWFNNGEVETMLNECPEGFIKGRIRNNDEYHKRSNAAKKGLEHRSWTLEQSKLLSERNKKRGTECMHTKELNFKNKMSHIDKRWYNNGERETLLLTCPPNYKRGRLKII